MAGVWAQTRLLLWKNALQKRRHPLSSLSELLLPLAFVLLVVWLQTLDPDQDVPAEAYTCPRQSSLSPSLLFPKSPDDHQEFIIELSTQGFGSGVRTVPPLPYLNLIASKLQYVIGFAPADPDDADQLAFIDEVRAQLDAYTAPFEEVEMWRTVSAQSRKVFDFEFCRFGKLSKVFNSSAEMLAYVKSDHYGASPWPTDELCPDAGALEHPKLHMALVVDRVGRPDSPSSWAYSIHTNMSSVPMTYPQLGFTDRIHAGVNERYLDLYMMSGFLTLQLAVDRVILATPAPAQEVGELAARQVCDTIAPLFHHIQDIFPNMTMPGAEAGAGLPDISNLHAPSRDCRGLLELAFRDERIARPFAGPARMLPNDVRMAEFPTPAYTDRPFYLKIKDVFALNLILTFLWPISRLIRGIVHEKETRAREGMRMMGLRPAALYLSWLATYGLLFFAIALCIVIMTGNGLFGRSSNVLVFAYFFMFGISIIAYCFVVAVLFNRAKTASTAGVVLFFMGFFGYFGVASDNASARAKAFASLLSPTAFGLGASTLASYEAAGQGVVWGTLFDTPNDTQISFGHILIMLAVDTVLYMLLAVYLDAVMPQEFGIRRPYNFLCTKRFWCGQKDKSRRSSDADSGLSEDEDEESSDQDPEVGTSESDLDGFVERPSLELRQLERDGRCVRLNKLTKVFDAGSNKRVAVNGLDLTMYEGQIFVLLGHNGAGKSTTINMLTGLIEKSKGSAAIYGHDTAADMDEIRSMLGVCPQHDILFPDLTVEEHLNFFANLKQVSKVDDEVARQIAEVGLTEKRNVLSRNLSGGQKRKLSVAIALLGNSKIVFLDEPTSGMDTYSRRATWNMLQNNRDGRVIVLTTHFMDEADLLGDRIAIMADGQLKCCGSSLFLKNKYGIGYTLTFALEGSLSSSDQRAARNEIVNVVRKFSSNTTVLSSVGTEVVFKVPFQSAENFPDLFRTVDDRKTALSIANYGVSITTLEEVFLKVASDEYNHRSRTGASREPDEAGGALMRSVSDARPDLALTPEEMDEIENTNRSISAAQRFGIHFRALFLKRMHYAKRDRRAICCNSLLPVLLLTVGLVLLKAFPMKNPPELELDMASFEQPENYFPVNFSSSSPIEVDFSRSGLTAVPVSVDLNEENTCKDDSRPQDIPNGGAARSLSNWLLGHHADNATSLYGAALLNRPENSSVLEAIILNNSTAKHGPALFLNALTRGLLPDPSASIKVTTSPFPFTSGFVNLLDSLGSIDASMSIVIAFSFVPASVAIFVVKEREVSAKHQQLLSGVSIGAYWVANLAWDLCMYLVPWVASSLLVWGFKISAFQGENLLAVVVLFFLFGLAVIPFTYCISFLFSSHSTAQNVVLLVNFITGLILFIASTVMSVIESTQAANRALKYVYRLFPCFSLGNALFGLTINKSERNFLPEGMVNSTAFSWDVAGAEMVYMAGSSVVYFAITVALDIMLSYPRLRQRLEKFSDRLASRLACVVRPVAKCWRACSGCCLCCRTRRGSRHRSGSDSSAPAAQPLLESRSNRAIHAVTNEEDSEQVADEDVVAERDRVEAEQGTSKDVILLRHLRKQFHDGKLAVRGLTIGVPPGECFGFLGVNGAGKTTTLRILTGDLLPTSGTARLAGFDILSEQSKLRRMIGYCPQFDALLENLTVREHLELYARLKCIPERLVSKVVEEKITTLNLGDFENKKAGALSGGNKRKLSVAIAMIGSPPLMFLDEPTTGMDPFNRRFLWEIIAAMSTDSDADRRTTVVLTSHSMEECEALCSKVGIVVGGQFRCYGSIQHLKGRFGSGLLISVRLSHPTSEEIKALTHKAKELMHGKSIRKLDIERVSRIWGNPDRAAAACEEGSPLGGILTRTGKIDALYLAEWWLVEDAADAVKAFFAREFPQSSMVERHDSQMRYRAPARKLSEVFGVLEKHKDELKVAQYAVSDPSLESIFNMFAQRQEEERGIPRGVAAEQPLDMA